MTADGHYDKKNGPVPGDTWTNANARQVGGDHYKTGGIELWDLFGPEAIIFYAARYLQRWRKKGGVEDLEKALHCVQKLREVAKQHQMRNVLSQHDGVFERWLSNTGMGEDEKTIVHRLVFSWKDDVELAFAERQIEYLIAKEQQPKVTLEQAASVGFDGKPKFVSDAEIAARVIAAHERRVPRYDTPSCGDGLADDHARQRAQQISLQPWLYDGSHPIIIETDLFNRFYTKRAPGLWVLDPHVVSVDIPQQLRACYVPRACDKWTLDVRRCPPEARSYFPSLQLTANAKEFEEMPEWRRALYAWDADKSKYQLTEQTEAWHVDAEEDAI